MSNKVILKLKGLNTDSNALGSVPEGSLLVAKNIVIDKDDVGELRRGYALFGEAMGISASNRAKQLIPYKDRILRNYEEGNDGILEYQDTPGSTGFTQFLGLKNIFGTLSVTGTNVQFTTENPHDLSIGDTVVIEGAAPSGYNGTFTVESLVSDSSFIYEIEEELDSPSGNPLLLESSYKTAFQTSDENKIRFVEANGNLYFTTEEGIKKIDTFDATVVDSGVSKALDVELSLYDNPSGYFSQEKQVGYRVLWGIKDANENLILGAASSRAFISNPGLALLIEDYNNLVATLTGEADISPISLNMVNDAATLTQVKAALTGTISTLDEKGAPLTGDYASISITGSTLVEIQSGYDDLITVLENEEALTGTYEFATTLQDVTLNFTIPQGITENHFYQVYRSTQSVDIDTPPNDDYQLVYEDNPTLEQLNDGVIQVVDITPDEFRGVALYQNSGQETDAQANEKPPFSTCIELFNNIVFYGNTKTVHRLQVNLVGLDPLTIGSSTLTISNSDDSFVINFGSEEDIDTNTALLDTDADKTVAQRVDSTARSIVRVINRITDNTLINAFYISGPNDAPGAMVFESRSITDGQFSVVAADSTVVVGGTTISAYNPSLVTAETSDNEVKPNRIYYSKLSEPEAVPLLNYFSVGGGDNVIRRLCALRDSLFVFSDEGVFRITGDDPSALVLASFDNTCIIKSANSLARGNNQIFVFTDQGVSTVSDTGIQIISRQIEDVLLPLLSSNYTNFNEATFGVFYQSDRKYVLFTVEEETDEVATIAYVYNTLTNTWVTWDLSKTCALVNPYDDKLYLGAADTNSLERERKNFDRTDHADRDHEVEILSVSRRITTISTGNPVQITAKFHGLSDGDTVLIEDSNSTPSIDGEYEVTIVDEDNFTIDTTVSSAGSSGKWTSVNREIPLVLELSSLTNVNVGDVIKQTASKTTGSKTYNYELELPISAVDLEDNTITLTSIADFTVGSATVFDYIPVEIQWVPIHAGDPSVLKHFRELHLMFDKFIGSDIKVECSSDIQSSKQSVDFDLNDFGNWGKFNWGKQPWGGQAITKNIRTYVPLGKQKCRLLNLTFKHEAAREQWRLEGIAAFYRTISSRTNRTS